MAMLGGDGGEVERAHRTVLHYLGVDESSSLPEDAVRRLALLIHSATETLRTAVLDRRVAGANWSEIGDAIGISKQAARRRFASLSGPRSRGSVRLFADLDSCVPESETDEDAPRIDWIFPNGDNPGSVTIEEGLFVDESGDTWRLCVAVSPDVAARGEWQRVGDADARRTGHVVAIAEDGHVASLGVARLACAARMMEALPFVHTLQELADVLATEDARTDAMTGVAGGLLKAARSRQGETS